MTKTFTNLELIEILNSASDSSKIFPVDKSLPMKIYWVYKKNIQKLVDIYQVYDDTRKDIMSNYPTENETTIPANALEQVNDLLQQKNEIELDLIKADEYMDLELTPIQSQVFLSIVFED